MRTPAKIDGVDDPAEKQGMTAKRDKLCKELNADQVKEAERLNVSLLMNASEKEGFRWCV
jgi:hypothetical protein